MGGGRRGRKGRRREREEGEMRREGNGERRKGVKEEQEKMRNEGERKRKKVGRRKGRERKATLMRATHSGCNVKVEDGGSGSLHVVLEELHHCVRGDLWAVDGNCHMSGVHECVFCQLVSHPCNEEGLPHARPSGADNPYTGAVCVCVCVCVCACVCVRACVFERRANFTSSPQARLFHS